MEKRKRHYSLDLVKKLVIEGNWEATSTALLNARQEFDFVKADLQRIVLGLQVQDFYKSMTCYHDSRVWQDVYQPAVNGIVAYIKISILNQKTLVVQFKRK